MQISISPAYGYAKVAKKIMQAAIDGIESIQKYILKLSSNVYWIKEGRVKVS